jgi:hypothetical protein
VQIEHAAALAVVGDPGPGDHVLERRLGIAAEPVLDARVAARPLVRALGQELQRPAPERGVDPKSVAEWLVFVDQ